MPTPTPELRYLSLCNGACYFCFAKSNQKHLLQHADHRVAMTPLCYSASPALAKLAIADRSDNARFSPGSPALLGGMKSRWVHRSDPAVIRGLMANYGAHQSPSAQPSTAGKCGRSERCLSPSKMGEFSERRIYRGAQGTRSVAEGWPLGCLFFCLLFFGQAKKRRARAGRRPLSKKTPKANKTSPKKTPRHSKSIGVFLVHQGRCHLRDSDHFMDYFG